MKKNRSFQLIVFIIFIIIIVFVLYKYTDFPFISEKRQEVVDTLRTELSQIESGNMHNKTITAPKELNLFEILSISLIGFLIVFFINYLIYSKKNNKKIKEYKDKIRSLKYDIDRLKNKLGKGTSLHSVSYQHKQNNESQITDHVPVSPRPEQMVETEENSMDNSSEIRETVQTEKEDNDVPVEKKQEVIYFSIPKDTGIFETIYSNKKDDGKKFYKIIFFENSTQGELHYISSKRDQQAIANLKAYLSPVCTIENIEDIGKANTIQMIDPGQVTLMNDSWVIDEKNKVWIKLI